MERPLRGLSSLPPWLAAGTAGSVAALISNPFDVAKTRLQLQNELVASNAAGTQLHYRNVFHCLLVTTRQEGVAAIQKGLTPAIAYNFSMQSIRLGIFSWFVTRSSSVRVSSSLVDLGAGFLGGMSAAAICSPLSLVKVRMQTFGSQVGAQQAYRGITHGILSIYREGGVRGLFAGSWASQMRVGVGSAAQLASYKLAKSIVSGTLKVDGLPMFIISSAISGIFTSLSMNPLDVVSTRLYNQGTNAKYRGVLDCLVKTVKTEGFFALWKGLTGQYARIVPHSIVVLVFSEILGFNFGMPAASKK